MWPIPSTAFPTDQREADLALVCRTVQKPLRISQHPSKTATTLANPTTANKLKKTNYANLDPESCKVNKQLFNELFYNIVFFLLLRYLGLLSLQLLGESVVMRGAGEQMGETWSLFIQACPETLQPASQQRMPVHTQGKCAHTSTVPFHHLHLPTLH